MEGAEAPGVGGAACGVPGEGPRRLEFILLNPSCDLVAFRESLGEFCLWMEAVGRGGVDGTGAPPGRGGAVEVRVGWCAGSGGAGWNGLYQ